MGKRTPSAICEDGRCDLPPRIAIKSARMSDRGIRSTIYYDDRTAPADAARYCKGHGKALAHDLVETLAAMDEGSKED